MEKIVNLKKNKGILFWAYSNPIKTIIIVAILVRVLLFSLYQYVTIYPDSEDYIFLAKQMLNFDLRGYNGGRSPGYPMLLCLADGMSVVTVVYQMIIGIVTLIFIYKTLLIINVKKNLALTITLLFSCYIPTIFFEFAILTESLTFLFVTLIFYTYFGITMQKRIGILSYLLLSLLCGYLVIIKPFYILIPVLLFVFLILHNSRFRTILSKYLFVLLFPLILFLGWSYVNKANTGYFVPTTFYGFNIAQNCVSFAENTTDEYKEIGCIYAKYRDKNIAEDHNTSMSIWDAYSELEAETGKPFPDLSKTLYDYSLTTIAMNPTDYFKQVFISWCDFWKTSLYWEYDAVAHANGALWLIAYAQRVLFQLIKILFVLFIPYNIVRYIRKRKYTPQFIISLTVLAISLAQALVTYGTNSRFSFPFEMLMLTSLVMNYLSYKRGRRMKQKS